MGRALRFLVDSVILIDHFNGIDHATVFIAENYRALAISTITRAELLTGFDDETGAMVASLLGRFPNLPIDEAIADLAARLRRRYRWKLPDALQAAVAKHHGLRLVTRNTKDFPPGRYDFVTVPYQIKPGGLFEEERPAEGENSARGARLSRRRR